MSFSVFTFPFLPFDPLSFWHYIHPHPHTGFFLGSGVGGTPQDSVVFMSAGEPDRIVLSSSRQGHLLDRIRRQLNRSSPCDFPRFIGYLNFDEGRNFDRGIGRLPRRPDPVRMPTSYFGDYGSVVKLDFIRRETSVYTLRRFDPSVDRMRTFLTAGFSKTNFLQERGSPLKVTFPSRGMFSSMVNKAKQAIQCGDIYQANISIRFSSRYSGHPVNLYRRLCQTNPSPYACLLKKGSDWVVSNSPELLMKVEGRGVVTRPIAGTRPRGRTPALDRRRKGQLLLSPKERAEHIMLVDLERNDLGRVCVPGSVHVSDRFAVERYSHVMHIVSEVKGKIRKGLGSVEALRAVFPGGTITGCPKIKSIEIIEKLEKVSRGLFYGSAGYFCGNGDAQFNILIRTSYIRGQRLYIQAGAGIVADSHPAREYDEVMAKARALLEAARKTNGTGVRQVIS